jgi:hypothetical protein
MASQLKPTAIGITKTANASTGGFLLNITSFKVTEHQNFLPGEALLGTPVYEGQIVTIESINSGTVKFTCEVPSGIPSAGTTWHLGEIGLYLEDGTLYAHGVLEPVYEKRLELGLRIHAIIAQTGVGEVINASLGTVHSVPSLAHIKNLPEPTQLAENVFVVLDAQFNTDNSSSPAVATRYGPGGGLWGFEGYTRAFVGQPLAVQTQSAFTLSSLINFVEDEVAIVQVTAGPAVGQTRRIRYSGSTWVEVDGKAFSGLTTGSMMALWRNPVSIIGALQARVELNMVQGTRWADRTEYNDLANQLNFVGGQPQGTWPNNYGWAQNDLPTLVSPAQPTVQQWTALFNRAKALASHLGLDTSNVVDDDYTYNQVSGVGMVSKSKNFSALGLSVAQTKTNHNLIPQSSLNFISPSGGTVVRTSSWTANVTHEILLTWPSESAMRAWFNAGGNLALSSEFANPVDAHDNDWHLFLAALQTVRLSAGTAQGVLTSATAVKGFYALTAGYSTVYSHQYVGATGFPINYTLNARLENANTQIRLAAVFSEISGAYATASNNGTLTSSCSLFKPGSSNLNSPTLADPILVSGGTI